MEPHVYKRGDKVHIIGGLHIGKYGIYIKSNGTNKLIAVDGLTKGIKSIYIEPASSNVPVKEILDKEPYKDLSYDFYTRIKRRNIKYLFLIDIENVIINSTFFQKLRTFIKENSALFGGGIHIQMFAASNGKQFLRFTNKNIWVSLKFAQMEGKNAADFCMTAFSMMLHLTLPIDINFFLVSSDHFLDELYSQIIENKQNGERNVFMLDPNELDIGIFCQKYFIDKLSNEEAIKLSLV